MANPGKALKAHTKRQPLFDKRKVDKSGRMGRPPRAATGQAERGLSRPLQAALDRDVFEDDDAPLGRHSRAQREEDEIGSGSEYGEMEGSDEEITSDEDGDGVGGRRGDRDDQSDLESLGSSVDPDEVTDLSKMLSDDDSAGSDDDGDAHGPSAVVANLGMLQAVGLRASRSRHSRERTEGLEESEHAVPDAPHLSVDDLLGSLGDTDAIASLRSELKAVGRGGTRRSAHAQLAAPVEAVMKRRLERQAAAEAAHRIVSGWEQAVHRNSTAETLQFPPDRQQAYGSTLGSLVSANSGRGPHSALEEGVEKLLEEHGLGERAAAEAELEALRDLGRAGVATPEEAEARLAEMKKMRDLLFYHEIKAKRIAKIKSRAYRKVGRQREKAFFLCAGGGAYGWRGGGLQGEVSCGAGTGLPLPIERPSFPSSPLVCPLRCTRRRPAPATSRWSRPALWTSRPPPGCR
jgi:U3 small nucleolar RNA-associated protein 14